MAEPTYFEMLDRKFVDILDEQIGKDSKQTIYNLDNLQLKFDLNPTKRLVETGIGKKYIPMFNQPNPNQDFTFSLGDIFDAKNLVLKEDISLPVFIYLAMVCPLEHVTIKKEFDLRNSYYPTLPSPYTHHYFGMKHLSMGPSSSSSSGYNHNITGAIGSTAIMAGLLAGTIMSTHSGGGSESSKQTNHIGLFVNIHDAIKQYKNPIPGKTEHHNPYKVVIPATINNILMDWFEYKYTTVSESDFSGTIMNTIKKKVAERRKAKVGQDPADKKLQMILKGYDFKQFKDEIAKFIFVDNNLQVNLGEHLIIQSTRVAAESVIAAAHEVNQVFNEHKQQLETQIEGFSPLIKNLQIYLDNIQIHSSTYSSDFYIIDAIAALHKINIQKVDNAIGKLKQFVDAAKMAPTSHMYFQPYYDPLFFSNLSYF